MEIENSLDPITCWLSKEHMKNTDKEICIFEKLA